MRKFSKTNLSLELSNSQYKLEDLCLQITDGKHGDCENQENSGYYFVSVKDIDEGEIHYSNARQITKYDFEDTDKRTRLENEDILITNSGTIGKFVFVNSPLSRKTTFQKSVAIIKPNKNKILPKFLYYYLISEKRRLIEYAGGTTQKNLLLRDIRNFEVEVPDEFHQKKIIEILNTIDELIKTKKKLNKNLTKLIDTNFKNYLLNFENYSEDDLVSSEFGPIPKEWEVNNLTGIANYQNGLAMQKFPPETPEDSFKVLKIKELRQGFFDESSDLCSKNIKEECIVYDGDVIFSWSGSLLVDIWTGGTCGLNQHLFKVTSSNFDKWFYYCWTKFYLDQFILIAKDKATTMGHIKRQHLEESLVLIPDEETYNNLTNLFKPLFEYLTKNKIEIKKLQSLRDTLLPKLMSGKIDVSKINCDL